MPTAMTIRVQAVRKTYPAPAHEPRKLVKRLVCANPSCQFWIGIVESEANFGIVSGIDWSNRSDESFLVVPRWLVKSIDVNRSFRAIVPGSMILRGLASACVDGPISSNRGSPLVLITLIREALSAGVKWASFGRIVGVQLHECVHNTSWQSHAQGRNICADIGVCV